MSTLRIALPVLLVACWTFGCSSNKKQAKEKVQAIESIESIADECQKGISQADQVIAAIDELQSGKKLKSAYGKFNKAVKRLEASADRVTKRRDSMQRNRDAYIKRWQEDLEKVQNPEVQASLAERMKAIRANFEDVQNAANGVRLAYQPLMRDLRDLQKALALDLNPAGVSALQPALDRARSEAITLKDEIAELQAELTEIAGSMST